MIKINMKLANTLIFEDPETGEELAPTSPPESTKEGMVIFVSNEDGTKKWKHTIKTEEV